MPRPLGLLALLVALLLPIAARAAAPVNPRVDAAGDPLPEGALARFGTLHLHHNGSVINVAFAPDGKTLASCGNDSLVRLWDAATGKEIRRFVGHQGAVDGVAFSPDGKTLLSSAGDGTARLWDVTTGKERMALHGHRGMVNPGIFSPDGKTIATKGLDATARLWDATTGKELHVFAVARDNGSPIAFSPDNKALALVHPDLAIRLYDVATAKEVQKLGGHGTALASLDFSPDGKVLASAGTDGTVRLWDVAGGKELRQLHGHEGSVSSVHFSPDGKLLATGGADKAVRFWDAATGNELRHGTGHTAMVSEVGFGPDGKVLASASWDNTVRLWDVATAKELPQSAGPGPLTCAALSADGKVLVTGHAGNGVYLWDAATGKPLGAALDLDGRVTTVAVSADGKLVAAGNAAGEFALWEAAAGRKRFSLGDGKQAGPARRRGAQVVAVSPDGRLLAVVSNEVASGVDLYDAATGQRLPSSLAGAARDLDTGQVHFPPHAVAFAPDGRTFLTASVTGGLKLHDSATGRELRQLLERADERTVAGIAFARDGRSLAAGASDGSVWLWETATGGQRRRWGENRPPDKAGPAAVAFSADGQLLAASDGKGVTVRHLPANKDLQTFEGHDGAVTALAFAAGGRMLSVSADGTAMIWDTSELKLDRKRAAAKVEAEVAWTGLDAPDPAKAYDTVARLAEAPEAAVGLLRQRLRPAAAADPKRIDQLIAQLNDDDFTVREKATEELAKLGAGAEKALRKAAEAAPSAEVTRRVAELLKKLDSGAVSGEGLREVRALEVLELLGTPEARKVLEELARGAPDAALTREAKASLERLARRTTP
jgi:WD40 repeat protein